MLLHKSVFADGLKTHARRHPRRPSKVIATRVYSISSLFVSLSVN